MVWGMPPPRSEILEFWINSLDAEWRNAAHLPRVVLTHSPNSPNDKIDVIVGDGDDHIGNVVRCVQVALHGGPKKKKKKI